MSRLTNPKEKRFIMRLMQWSGSDWHDDAEWAEREILRLRAELAAACELLHKLTAIIPGNDGAGKEVAEFLATLAKEGE